MNVLFEEKLSCFFCDFGETVMHYHLSVKFSGFLSLALFLFSINLPHQHYCETKNKMHHILSEGLIYKNASLVLMIF